MSWSSPRKPRNGSGWTLALGAILAVVWVAVAVRVAGTIWALPVAGVAVVAVFSMDRLTVWRHRPSSVRADGRRRVGALENAPANTDDWFKDAA